MPRHPVIDPDAPAVTLNEHLRDVEAESLPAPGIRAPHKPGEERGLDLIWHPRSGILDRDLDRLIVLFDPDGDLDPGLPELDAVADEVREDLRKEVVGHDLDRLSRIDDPGIRVVGDLRLDDGVEVDGSRRGLAGMQPPDRRDVLDDFDAPADAFAKFPNHLLLFFSQELGEQVGVTESDGIRVVNVVHHDIEVEVCLVMGRPQRFLRPDPVGDIGSRTDHRDRPAVVAGKDGVLPREDQLIAVPRDDRALSPVGQGCAGGERGVKDLPPRLPDRFRNDGRKPVLPEQFLLLIAEQFAAVPVDEPDGMVGVDNDKQDACYIQITLREVPLFLHLAFPSFELFGEGGDDEGDDNEHQDPCVIVQGQEVRPVEEAARDDKPPEEDSDQYTPFLPPERGQDDRDVEEM